MAAPLTFEKFLNLARRDIITFAGDEMRPAFKAAYHAIRDDDPVLIVGETGTGKELFVQTIHRLGSRGNKPLVPVNCATLRDNDVEQKMFGVRAGAFSNVNVSTDGRFRQADHGTLFLDELHRLSSVGRDCLLRTLETGEVVRYGDDWDKKSKVDVRIIAAANQNIDDPEVFPEDVVARIGTPRGIRVFVVYKPATSKVSSFASR